VQRNFGFSKSEETPGKNAVLLTFFKKSIFWKQQLHEWRKTQEKVPEFATLVETQLYSLAQHTRTVWLNHEGLQRLLAHPDVNTTAKGIPFTVQNIIFDFNHFKWNSIVFDIVFIIAKCIATLEKTNATLAD
jgi:hypothetical protein